MKKVTLGLIFFWLVPFISSHAQTLSNEALIQSLLQQISSLQTQIQILQNQQNSVTSVNSATNSSENSTVTPSGYAEVYTQHNFNKTWHVYFYSTAKTWTVKKTDDKTGATDWTHPNLTSVEQLGNSENCGLIDDESNRNGCIGTSIAGSIQLLMNNNALPRTQDNTAVTVWQGTGRIAVYRMFYVPSLGTFSSQKIQGDNTTWTHPDISALKLADEFRFIQGDNQSGTLTSRVRVTLDPQRLIIGAKTFIALGIDISPFINFMNDSAFKTFGDAISGKPFVGVTVTGIAKDDVAANSNAYNSYLNALGITGNSTQNTGGTSNPPAQSTPSFKNGDTVKATNNINVRATPNGSLLGQQSAGSTGTILTGPSSAAGLNWWFVDFKNAPDGWSAENYLSKYTQTTETTPATGAPVISFTSPQTEGGFSSGSTAVLFWSTTGANTCYGTGDWSGIQVLNGFQNVGPLYKNSTFNLNCTNYQGQLTTKSLTITVNLTTPTTSACSINYILSNPSSITAGQTSQLSYLSTGCQNLSLSGGEFNGRNIVVPSGTITTSPLYQTTTYTLNGTDSLGIVAIKAGPATATITVNQTAPLTPSVSVSASPSSITFGQSSTITWSSTNATSCSAPWMFGSATSGSQSVGPINQTTTYTATCVGAGGSNSAGITINVTSIVPPPAPAVSLKINSSYNLGSSIVSSGAISALDWSATNATSCTGSNFVPHPNINGGLTNSESIGPLYQTTAYTLTCTGVGGTNSASVTMTVLAPTTVLPSAPVGLSATPGACGTGVINLSWGAVTGAVSYSIYGGNNAYYGGMPLQVSIPGTSYSDSGVTSASSGFTPGNTYSYYVTARNSVGESQPSATVSAIAPSACLKNSIPLTYNGQPNLASVNVALEAILKSFQELIKQGILR